MQDDPLKDEHKAKADDNSGVSRRDFLKISTISAAAVPILGTKIVQAAGEPVKVYGPGKTPVELTINGQKHTLQLEPRVTFAISWTSPVPSGCVIVQNAAPALCCSTTSRYMRARFWPSKRRESPSLRSSR
jgi:hypothetical protein